MDGEQADEYMNKEHPQNAIEEAKTIKNYETD